MLQVTNYDVLCDRMPGRRYVLEGYRKHIGNTRFAVLVDMYHEAYNMLLMSGNSIECEKIAERIVGVACHKDVAITVNKGRFLVREFGEGAWVCLDEEESKKVVQQALAAPHTVLEEPENDPEELRTSTVFSAMNVGFDFPPFDESDFENDKKRGRRRSLLRRSASDSTMMDDKKKLQIRGLGLDTMVSVAVDDDDDFNDEDSIDISVYQAAMMPRPIAPSIESSKHLAAGGKVRVDNILNWKGMDVVMSHCGETMVSDNNIVGNNRLRVMLSLQQDTYRKSLPDDRDSMIEGLIRTVCSYWGGRMLMDQGFEYIELSHPQRKIVMKNLLDPDNAQPINISPQGTQKSLLLGNSFPVPAFLQKASIDILAGTTSSPVYSQILQSQAIKSQKERHAKRSVAKTLGRKPFDGESQSSTEEM